MGQNDCNCPICLEAVSQYGVNCNHGNITHPQLFHYDCLLQCFYRQSNDRGTLQTCPLCNISLTPPEISYICKQSFSNQSLRTQYRWMKIIIGEIISYYRNIISYFTIITIILISLQLYFIIPQLMLNLFSSIFIVSSITYCLRSNLEDQL